MLEKALVLVPHPVRIVTPGSSQVREANAQPAAPRLLPMEKRRSTPLQDPRLATRSRARLGTDSTMRLRVGLQAFAVLV